jgi:hypothetical protein
MQDFVAVWSLVTFLESALRIMRKPKKYWKSAPTATFFCSALPLGTKKIFFVPPTDFSTPPLGGF